MKGQENWSKGRWGRSGGDVPTCPFGQMDQSRSVGVYEMAYITRILPFALGSSEIRITRLISFNASLSSTYPNHHRNFPIEPLALNSKTQSTKDKIKQPVHHCLSVCLDKHSFPTYQHHANNPLSSTPQPFRNPKISLASPLHPVHLQNNLGDHARIIPILTPFPYPSLPSKPNPTQPKQKQNKKPKKKSKIKKT